MASFAGKSTKAAPLVVAYRENKDGSLSIKPYVDETHLNINEVRAGKVKADPHTQLSDVANGWMYLPENFTEPFFEAAGDNKRPDFQGREGRGEVALSADVYWDKKSPNDKRIRFSSLAPTTNDKLPEGSFLERNMKVAEYGQKMAAKEREARRAEVEALAEKDEPAAENELTI